MPKNKIEFWDRISLPVEIATAILVTLGLLMLFMLPHKAGDIKGTITVCVVAAIYVAVYFRVLMPRFSKKVWVQVLNSFFTVVLLGYFSYVTGLRAEIDVLFVMIVSVTGIILGLPMVLLMSVLATLSSLVVSLLLPPITPIILIAIAFRLVVYVLSGYLSTTLSGTIRSQADETAQRNRSLALLLEMSNLSESLDLENNLPRLAERIVKGLSSSYCSIHLLNPDTQELVTYGSYPARTTIGRPPGDQPQKLEMLHWHRRALEIQQVCITRQDVPALAMSEEELGAMMLDTIQSACLVPLVFEKQSLGVISVGEERRWDREPFSGQKMELLNTIAAQAAVVINNARLHRATRRQLERMEVINEVTRAIGSTIEMDSLLEQIYQQISRVIPAESYFVGLYNSLDDTIDMHIIIDDDTRFPPYQVPSGTGLTGYVIRERKPMLVRHLSQEKDHLPVNIVSMGYAKLSESWLGVPILINEKMTGVLAVASYQPNAFTQEDVSLLSNVAMQAAMAIDNARHHSAVEEQSRRDSLTGVYNHSYFLERLRQAVESGQEQGQPVSMIMLDIDHFKKYNDTYGHVTGDEVLRSTVQAIQTHIQPTDTVGRWGGEEFGVVLPNMTCEQARLVAERIRRTLADLPVVNSSGQSIPAPTISQGIATFPSQAGSASQLVDIADRALYQAKEKGRDQIQAAPDCSQP